MAQNNPPGIGDLLGLFGGPMNAITKSIGQFQRGVSDFLSAVENFNKTMEQLHGVAERVNGLLDTVEGPAHRVEGVASSYGDEATDGPHCPFVRGGDACSIAK